MIDSVLMFYSHGLWDEVYDRPAYTVRPIKTVANYYETVPELIFEAFELWAAEGYPTFYQTPIGLTYTKKKKLPRRIFLRIHYDPDVFYCDGTIGTEVEWGTKGQTRGYGDRVTSFSLEPILSRFTHEKRSKE